MQDLVMPWMHSDRVAYGNSHFASVPAARMMMRYGMGFIGVVKSASRQYPIPYLSQVELNNRGDRKGMVKRGGQTNSEPKMMAFCLDGSTETIFHCNMFFACGREPLQTSAMEAAWGCIFRWTCQSATCWFSGSSTKSGRGLLQNMCYNWLPQSSSTGYAGDWSKLVTQNWSMRVNLTVFSMIVVDSWLAFSQYKGKSMVEIQKTFYTLHAQELIDSRLDVPNVRLRMSTPRAELNWRIFDRTGDPRAGVSAHLTPTKMKRQSPNGDILPFSLQGRCQVCKCLSTFMCSLCEDSLECMTTTWICHTKKGMLCFPTHLEVWYGEWLIGCKCYFMSSMIDMWWYWRRWLASVNVKFCVADGTRCTLTVLQNVRKSPSLNKDRFVIN